MIGSSCIEVEREEVRDALLAEITAMTDSVPDSAANKLLEAAQKMLQPKGLLAIGGRQ
jgi:hypothetical protein